MATSVKFTAWIDAAASAASFAMAVWLYHASQVAVTETVAKYGRNVDSGVYELIAANWYFFPSFAVLGVAAVAIFSGWGWLSSFHWLEWLLLLVSIVWLMASEISRVMV